MDWDQLLNEAIKYLQEYIRIITVNPPGNEIEGAKLFKRIFEKESILCEIFEPSPGRGSLLAVLKGNQEKKPILLLSHIDVVPVEMEHWNVDPFEGKIKDGYLYGRGTLDDKAMGIVEMMALLILKREQIPLKRDILFYAAADEEIGNEWGIQWALDHIPLLSQSEYALNEGRYVFLDESGKPNRYEISNAQKVVLQLRLKVQGAPGHASMPHSENPNVKLIRALSQLIQWETPYHILPSVKDYFLKIAPKQPPDERPFYEDIQMGLKDPSFSTWLTTNPIYNAILRDTISITLLQGGSRVNVIPSESTATLDCRLIPGSSKEIFLKGLEEILGKEVKVEIIGESQPSAPSPLNTDLFLAIQKYASIHDPDCPVVSLLLPEATDSSYLRERGIITYDFCPFRLTENELLRIHGNDERIAITNIEFGMKMMVDVIQEVAV